eukprot:559278-Hanusia_phi.AAC.1
MCRWGGEACDEIRLYVLGTGGNRSMLNRVIRLGDKVEAGGGKGKEDETWSRRKLRTGRSVETRRREEEMGWR